MSSSADPGKGNTPAGDGSTKNVNTDKNRSTIIKIAKDVWSIIRDLTK
jgi:hypothetical protein